MPSIEYDSPFNEPEEPAQMKRSPLEEQLASVIEGEAFVVGSSDVASFSRPTHVRLTRVRKRRQRMRRPRPIARIKHTYRDTTRDNIANLDRVIVAFRDTSPHVFRQTPIAIRRQEHERSPFVVSLREVLLINVPKDDTYVLHTDILSHDVRSESVPNLALLEALASDLHVQDSIGIRYSDQFTPLSFRLTYQQRYGMFSDVANWVRRAWNSVEYFFRRKPRASAMHDFQNDVERLNAVIERPRKNGIAPLRVSRAALIVCGLALVAMLPANIVRLARSLQSQRAAVESAGREAVAHIETLPTDDLSASIESLKKANARFLEADELLTNTNAIAVSLASVLPTTRSSYRTAKALLEIGSSATEAGGILAKGFSAAVQTSNRSILDRLSVISTYANGALPLLERASEALARIDEGMLPEDERAKLEILASNIENGRIALREFVGVSDLLSDLLGRDEKKRYLLVFQNPNELRPTGGFMGSYAELDVFRGQIQRFVIPGGGTYDLQGQLTAQVVPPKPLRLIADRWEFQDSNWSPDFPQAAEKMEYFWMKSGGYTIDGVIAVNATLVERLLSLTGPIDVPELGKTISAENFMIETQKSAEIEYDRTENQPKKILGLLGPRLIERLQTMGDAGFVDIISVLTRAIETKDIQIAFTDPDAQALSETYSWSGRMKETPGDALAVIAANIAGQKTDRAIRERVLHVASISNEGKITNEVTLEREHTGNKGEIFEGVRNVTYFRFYVPKGSALVRAEGFDEPAPMFFDEPREDAIPDESEAQIQMSEQSYPEGVTVWDEGNRTVIGGWSMVDPGNTDILRIAYRVPFSAYDIRERLSHGVAESDSERAAYTLLLTSQSGKADRVIETRVIVPESWTQAWTHNDGSFSGPWEKDTVVSALYTTKETQ